MVTTKLEQGEATADDLEVLKNLIEMQDTTDEVEPSDRVVSAGDDTNPAMMRTRTVSAGYVTLRRQTDGKLVDINRNQLLMRLRERLPNGQRAWLRASEVWNGRRREGSTLCRLHPEHDDRAHMDSLGLGICGDGIQAPKANLLNRTAVDRHMRAKHKDAFEAIKEDEARRREDARDEAQAAIAVGVRESLRGPVVEAPRQPEKPLVSVSCGLCGEEFDSKIKVAAHSKMKKHQRQAHGGEAQEE